MQRTAREATIKTYQIEINAVSSYAYSRATSVYDTYARQSYYQWWFDCSSLVYSREHAALQHSEANSSCNESPVLVVWSQFSWREKTPSHDDTSAREKEKRKNRRRNKQLIRHYNRLSLWGRGRCGSSCGADGQHAESFRLFHTDSELNDRWTRSKLGPIRRSFSGRINISSRQCR